MSKDKGNKTDTSDQKATIGSGFREKSLGEVSDWDVVKRIWELVYPYRWLFACCLGLLPILSGLKLLQPHLLEIAIDEYLVPGKYSGLTTLIAIFGLTVFAQGAVQFAQYYLMQKAGQKSLYDLREKLFGHVQDQSIQFFHKRPVGRLMARMTTDVESLQDALTSGLITMIGDFVTLIGIVAILLYKDWQLALVSFTVLPFLIGLASIFRHFLRKAYRKVRLKVARLYAHLQESINGVEVIQMFARENVSSEEYRDINTEYRDANIQAIRHDAMLYAVVEAIGSITVGAIIWYGSGQVLDGVVTIGVLVAFIQYMQKFFIPIRDIAQKYNLLQSALAAGERIFDLLDTDERLESGENAPAVHTSKKPIPEPPYRLDINDLWFAYNNEEWVLKDIDLHLEPGEKLALVGHTGAGKTTLMDLVMRMYDIQKGDILLNGTDIRQFHLRDYRRLFACVLQDSFLFSGTIEDNIKLFDNEIDHESVVEAARTVKAHSRIKQYRNEYHEPLQERGNNLSTGEKQLLTFARALVQKPHFLLLDEATANVDTKTEQLIQEAVNELLNQQTSMVIAHRLSTIENADRIIVLDEGEIIERGTHSQLLDKGGAYRQLYNLQFSESDLHQSRPPDVAE